MAYKELDGGIVLFTKESNFYNTVVNQFQPQPVEQVPAELYNEIVLKQLSKFGEYKWWNKDTTANGTNNQYPTVIINGLAGSAAAAIALETLCVYTYGKGLGVFERGVDENGKEQIKPVLDETHQQFFIETSMPDYCIRAITDYWTFANQFATLIKNKAGDKFVLIKNTDAPFCRLGWQNDKTGKIDYVLVSGAWQYFPTSAEYSKVKLLDRYNYREQLEANPKVKKWMFRTYSYSPGNVYYHKHPWHAALDTGVLDIAPEIPKIRKNRLQKSLFVKYHVQINSKYWEQAMGEKKWAASTTDEKVRTELRELKNTVYAMIDSHLGGTDNAYKSLFSDFFVDPRTGAETSMIKITKVETDYGDSAAFDPDKMSNVADIFLAFGIPAPIMNTVLSDSKSRGGGSDIREGILAFQQRLKWHRDNILAPVDFMMRYNGYLKPNQFLAFEDLIPTTLDANPTGVEKTVAA